MNKKIMLLLFVIVLTVGLVGFSTAGSVDENGDFQGYIEANDVDINTKIPGRISEIKVLEGEVVKKGDVIAVIDIKDIVVKREGLVALSHAAESGIKAAEAQYNAALSKLDAAKSLLKKAENGTRNQNVVKAREAYEYLKKTYDRLSAVYEKGGVSKSKLDEIETKMNVAYEDYLMAKEGARSEDIIAARANVHAAEAMVEAALNNVEAAKAKYAQAIAGINEVDTYIADSKIVAPIDGTVTLLNSSEGEMVSSGMNIATITNLDDIWVEIEVDERNLSEFNIGDKVKITTLSYKDKMIEGEVVRINKKPDYAVKRASNENGKFDLVSYGVKIKFNNDKKLYRPGMTAIVSN